MAVQHETYRTYQIPENFVDDSRIIKGMFRTKNFIEAVVLTLIALIPAMLIPLENFSQRITAVILICGPFFVLGVLGINGDTFFSFLRNMHRWRTSKSVFLFNSTPRDIAKTPLEALMESESAKDKLIDVYEKFRNAQSTRNNRTLVEGVNFEFKEDPTLKRLYVSEEEKDVVKPDEEDIVDDVFDLAQKIDNEKLIEMINETSPEDETLEEDIPLIMFEEVEFDDL